MSALVSSQGAAFVTETGTRSASAAGAFLTETVAVGAVVNLAGDLAPALAFSADLSVSSVSYVDLAGDLAPSTSLAASLGLTAGLAGDLAPSVSFVADTANLLVLTGGLAPSVAFGADITV